jgi:hypothetical protein
MTTTDINTLKEWFSAGKKPTQDEYWAILESYWHKNETIPFDKIGALRDELDKKEGKQADIKYIDDLVSERLYDIQSEDLGKTLVYSGNEDITIKLSTLISFNEGFQLIIQQSGAGNITFATDGFILNHTNDMLPQLYGQHAIAAIMVTKAGDKPEVLLYGKLKLA